MRPKSAYEIALIVAATFGFMAATSGVGLFLFHRSGVEGSESAGPVFHGAGGILVALVALGLTAGVVLVLKARRDSREKSTSTGGGSRR